MSLQIGIVGLPNVGKSTLFQALTRKQVPAENYPFCTIDPNVGVVAVPDPRLEVLSAMSKSQKILPTTIEFVDIAGLVKGASQGEGLGNQFLQHIRECDAVAHVIRHFTNKDVIHVNGKIAPQDDLEVIFAELALADLSIVDKTINRLSKQNKTAGSKELEEQMELLKDICARLNQGENLSNFEVKAELKTFLTTLNLITTKPSFYINNVDENAVTEKVELLNGSPVISISAKIEAELAALSPEDAKVFLTDLGWTSSGLDRVILAAYETLGLITYLTTGEMETRAWTITKGTKAPEAAGEIHTDFIKGFVRAEIVSYSDLVDTGSWSAAREKGKLRVEGKDYVMQDGDVVNFLINK